jgi:very-short-patch-repair endonuclease
MKANNKQKHKLTPLAQHLRKKMTKEERHLWYDFLKDIPTTVNRQKVIGPYIADFYCASAKLVIELDGSQHYDSEGIIADEERDKYLRSLGLTIKRYSNDDVNNNFEYVCKDISCKIFPEEE